MKVKKSTKKTQVTQPEIEAVVQRIVACEDAALPVLLREIFPSSSGSGKSGGPAAPNAGGSGTVWKWPRGDLHSWIPVLDKFDAILERVLREYNLGEQGASTKEAEQAGQPPAGTTSAEAGSSEAVASPSAASKSAIFSAAESGASKSTDLEAVVPGLQINDFDEQSRDLLHEILRIQRVLLDNSTSRKLFSSYDRLSALLFTSDEHILCSVLSVLLRPAAQYSIHTPFELSRTGNGGRHAELHIRLLGLAFGWGTYGMLRDKGLDMVALADPSTPLSREVRDADIQVSFYRKGGQALGGPSSEGVHASVLEQPTADLQLGSQSSSQGQAQAQTMAVDSPSRPAPGGSRSTPLKYSFGLGGVDTPGPSTPSLATPRPPVKRAPSTIGLDAEAGIQSVSNSDGLTVITVPASFLSAAVSRSESPSRVLAQMVRQYEIPRSEWYSLLGKLRASMVLTAEPDVERRRDVIVARLLALATYLYLTPEDMAQTELFLYEQTLVSQLAGLAHPSAHDKVGDRVLASTFTALEACARYRSKSTEVLTAVNANVGHGILMSSFRSLVTRLAGQDDVPHELVDSMIAFLAYAATIPSYGNMLLGAGVIPQLVDLIKIDNPTRASYVARAIGLTDSMLYTHQNAFQIFINAGGLDIMISRIALEMDRVMGSPDTPESTSETETFRKTTVLKLLLRSIQRMMQSSGTTEGLRNLVDSSLMRSLQRIFEHSDKVGSSVFALSLNVVATFVHNEPTSLTVIQEMKLHEALCDALRRNQRPTFEVLSAAPNAIGALCLNDAGLKYTVDRPAIVTGMVDAIASQACSDPALQERDNATFLGTGLDELIRHQPQLKPTLLDATLKLLRSVKDMASIAKADDMKMLAQYQLVSDHSAKGHADEPMPIESAAPTSMSEDSSDDARASSGIKGLSPESINVVIEVVSKFLQGLLHNANFTKELIELSGVDLVVSLYDMPGLASRFAVGETAAALNQVVRSMAEANVSLVLGKIIQAVDGSLRDCRAVWQTADAFAELTKIVTGSLAAASLDELNVTFRCLIRLTNLIGLVCDLFVAVGFAHGRVATAFLQALRDPAAPELLQSLGSLQRASILANIVLKVDHPSSKGKEAKGKAVANTGLPAGLTEQLLSPQLEDGPMPQVSADSGDDSASQSEAARHNHASVKYVATQLSLFLAPFLQSINKMLLFRRMDVGHKEHAVPVGKQLASVLVQHLQFGVSSVPIVEQSYQTTMLGVVSLYLLDARPAQGSLQTLLVTFVQELGGFAKIASIAGHLMSELQALTAIPEASRPETYSQGLARTFGSFRMVMDLIKSLVTSKTITDASQTVLLAAAGRDKPLGDADHFDATELLVSLRLTFFDVIYQAWSASWVAHAPLPIARSIVQSMLAVLGDLPKPTPATSTSTAADLVASLRNAAAAVPPAPFVVNEIYVDMLTEMGFARHAAEHALTRLRNNVSAATEYLLSHAHLIPEPAVAPAPAEQPAAHAEGQAGPAAGLAGAPASTVADVSETGGDLADAPDVEMESAEDDSKQSADDAASKAEASAGQAAELKRLREEERSRLDRLCKDAAAKLSLRCLELVDYHEGLVFDVSSIFVKDVSKGSLEQILSGSPLGSRSRLRLLAVILHGRDAASQMTETTRQELMERLVQPLRDASAAYDSVLAARLLCAQALFRMAEDIRSGKVKDDVPDDVCRGPLYQEARNLFLSSSLEVVRSHQADSDLVSAALRMLVQLTRSPVAAQRVLEEDCLPTLLRLVASNDTKENGLTLCFVVMIMRHVVETRATLQERMQREIRSWFIKPRSKVVDVNHFISNNRQVALRDPNVFVQAVKAECTLTNPEPTLDGPYHIQAKSTTYQPGQPEDAKPVAADDPFQAAASAEATQNEPSRDKLMQLLSSELLDLRNVAAPTASEVSPAAATDLRAAMENNETYHRVCALMLTLTEMLGSYTGCKLAFINHSPKLGEASASHQGRSRPPMITFLLNELVCKVSLDTDVASADGAASSSATKRWSAVANWASAALVALCADVGTGSSLKDIPSELTTVRKTVLETIVKTLRDVSSSTDDIALRYGKLWALSELSYRLLTAKASIQPKTQDDTALHIAKLMLEKGFVPAFTNTLTEIDLNYPNSKILIANILQPLEYLTKLSTKMGKAEKAKARNEVSPEDVSSDEEMESDEDEDEAMPGPDEDEEAPDLYRNSALGMFGGEMDEYMDGDEGEGDEDDDEDAEHYDDDDMDDDSDGTEPSSDSDMEEWDDEDMEEHIMNHDGDEDDEHSEGGPAEFIVEDGEALIGLDGPEADDDEDIDDGDGLGDDMEYDDEEGDEEDEDIMELEEDEADFDDLYPVVDAPAAASANGGMEAWGWANAPQAAAAGDGNGARARRRYAGQRLLDADASVAMFGRARGSAAATPPLQASEHPLLRPEPEAEPATRPTVRRGGRQEGAIGDMLQSLDGAVGGDAMYLLDRLMAQTGGRPGEVIRVQYEGPGSAVLDFQMSRNGDRETSSASAVPPADLTESSPQPTLTRWSEEEKLIVGSAANERVVSLATWVINALLPEAKERHAKARQKLAEEEAEAERKAEESRKQAEAEAAEKEARETELAAQAVSTSAITGESSEATASSENAADAMQVEVNETQSASAEVEAAEPAAPRVTILIHGAEVDITETGIDPEFLEALPDDMRADVVNQHMQARQPAQPSAEQAVASDISPEFLDALPPEIRAEVIQQEAIEAARRAGERRGAPAAASAGEGARPAGNSGQARFLGGLDPALREVVMMEQDEDLLQLAGASGLQRARQAGRLDLPSEGADAGLTGAQADDNKKPAPKDAIQLLDRNGIASLVRLLFFPDLSKRNYLMRVLTNLCENARSRAEVINLILGVLIDGSGDTVLTPQAPSIKAKGPLAATPKSTPRRKNVPEPLAVPLSMMFQQLQAASVPAFLAQRCFEALSHIISHNDQASTYFLTESESLPVLSRKPLAKKGKGKDRPDAQYPLVALLSLLERHTLLGVPNMMESLTSLLATITKPLLALAKAKSSSGPADAPASSTAGAAGDVVSISAVVATATADAPSSAVTPAATIASEAKGLAGGALKSPPTIPHDTLRLVARILTAGDCTSRTFGYTLMLIQHLSAIPDARNVIAAELRFQAQTLADGLATDLRVLAGDLPSLADKAADATGISLTKFAPASSSQAKLLRILKTIDYMFTTSDGAQGLDIVARATSTEAGAYELTKDEERANEIYSTLHLKPCWQALGECLSLIDGESKLNNVATVLLPLVESLMVVCKYASAKAAAERVAASDGSPMSPMSPKQDAVSDDLFVAFTNSHRKILNLMVRNNPSLMSGSFALLILNPRILEFENKRSWFSQQLRKKSARDTAGVIHLAVRRQYVFDDSYHALQRKSGDALKYGKLSVKFYGEEGVDAGGVTREWYSVLAQSIFNPGYCLFEPCAADQLTYQPSQRSWVNGEHLGYFRFIGKMIGKAIFDGRLLDAYFSRAFYKQILGRKVDLRDLESVDPEYHKSLVWMLDNDITNVIDLDFSLEVDEFGDKKVIDLKPDGASIPVTEENKEEYVRLVVQYRLDAAIKDQVGAFLDGFYDIIPRKLISIFDPDQLELLISGISVIDVDELKNATQLHGWKDTDPEITWFWRALRSFSQEERARFLMFVTSSSRVPLQGFAHLQGSSGVQPFQIHKLYREDVLPSAATCFNELLLPSYPNYEALRSRLLTAITEGSRGFGLA